MILKLKEGKIDIQVRPVPELIHKVKIEYLYEFGTNHLKPVLYMGMNSYPGDNIKVDFTEPLDRIRSGEDAGIMVELMDGNDVVVHRYRVTTVINKYCLFGQSVFHPDMDDYITQLEEENKKLREEGEVI